MNEQFFLKVYPALVAALLLVWAGLAAWNARPVATALKGIAGKRALALLAVIFLGGLIARLVLIRPRHIVYFDEFVHMDIATNIAKGGTFGESTMIEGGSRSVAIVPSWPGGYHVLLGAAYKVFGAGEPVAYRFSEVAGALCVAVAFLFATFLFEDWIAGLWAAFLVATLPLHLRHSATTDLTVLSAFWLLASALSLQLYVRLRSYSTYLLLLATVAFAVNVRFENALLIPFSAAVLWRHWKRHPLPGAQGYVLPHALLFCAVAPVVVISWHNRAVGVVGYSDTLPDMVANLVRNLPGNVLYLLRQPHKSMFLLPFAVYSLAKTSGPIRQVLGLLLSAGAAFVLAASVHVNGTFLYAPTARLALPWLLVLIIAASWSLARATSHARPWTGVALAAVSLALCWPAYAAESSPIPEMENGIVASTPLPPDAVILSNCPAFTWTVAHRTSISAAYFDTDSAGLLEILDRSNRPLYLYKGGLWYLDGPISRTIEERLLRGHRLEPIRTEGSGEQQFGIYKLARLPAERPKGSARRVAR